MSSSMTKRKAFKIFQGVMKANLPSIYEHCPQVLTAFLEYEKVLASVGFKKSDTSDKPDQNPVSAKTQSKAPPETKPKRSKKGKKLRIPVLLALDECVSELQSRDVMAYLENFYVFTAHENEILPSSDPKNPTPRKLKMLQDNYYRLYEEGLTIKSSRATSIYGLTTAGKEAVAEIKKQPPVEIERYIKTIEGCLRKNPHTLPELYAWFKVALADNKFFKDLMLTAEGNRVYQERILVALRSLETQGKIVVQEEAGVKSFKLKEAAYTWT